MTHKHTLLAFTHICHIRTFSNNMADMVRPLHLASLIQFHVLGGARAVWS